MGSASRSRAFVFALLALLLAAFVAASPAAAEETSDVLGNNLSVPVVFADGYNITGGDLDTSSGFRGTMLADNFATSYDATTFPWTPYNFVDSLTVDYADNPLNSSWFYEQKTGFTWQAEWVDATSLPELAAVDVDRLDWGDSLLAKKWPVRAKIRLEVRLYRVNDLGLVGYAMNHLYGEGITEVWGAADASLPGAAAPLGAPNILNPAPTTTVYTSCARLSLYKIGALGDTDPADDEEIFSMAVADKYGSDGPGGFGAETNVGGYVLYGYTLDGKAEKLIPGFYRVKFSLDPTATWAGGSATNRVVIEGLDSSDTTGEWYTTSQYSATESWVDIELVATSGGGKKPR